VTNNDIQESLQQLLGSTALPVAVSFRDTPPAGIDRIDSAAPAGCAYWRLAAEGKVFYTIGEDHLNCPIGAYTHGAQLTADAQSQLAGTIDLMVRLEYLRMEEVPRIPKRTQPLRYVVYAPLAKVQSVPDAILLRGNARQIMLIIEAASAQRLTSELPIMGRPACAVIVSSIESGRAATSLGCIGNRVYTQLPDDEFYVALPGHAMAETVKALRSIVSANVELEKYHRGRAAAAGPTPVQAA
jgi:uncharacterized protein (DUF169 family)